MPTPSLAQFPPERHEGAAGVAEVAGVSRVLGFPLSGAPRGLTQSSVQSDERRAAEVTTQESDCET